MITFGLSGKRPLGSWMAAMAVTLLPASLPAQEDPAAEIQELRSMVLTLHAEVQALRAEVATLRGTPGSAAEAPVAAASAPLPAATPAPAPAPAPAPKPAVASQPVLSRYGLSVYGFIKVDAYRDSANPSHQEVPFWVRRDAPGSDAEFDITAKESRLGFDLAGPEVEGGNLSGKFEVDLYGDIVSSDDLDDKHAYKLRTRHAYVQWDTPEWSLLAGQTWDPYIGIFPSTLNFGYYTFAGQIGLRKAQVRVTRHLSLGGDTKLDLTAAVVEPTGRIHGGDADGDCQDDGADSGMPLFASKATLRTPMAGKQAEVFVAGVYGQEDMDLLGASYDVWAVQAGASLPLTSRVGLKLNVFGGSNLDSLWGGIGQGVNLGRREAIESVGGWAQLSFAATKALTLNLGVSADDPRDGSLSPGARAINSSLLINGYYTFSPALILGLELLHGETGYLLSDGEVETATNNRVQSSVIFKF